MVLNSNNFLLEERYQASPGSPDRVEKEDMVLCTKLTIIRILEVCTLLHSTPTTATVPTRHQTLKAHVLFFGLKNSCEVGLNTYFKKHAFPSGEIIQCPFSWQINPSSSYLLGHRQGGLDIDSVRGHRISFAIPKELSRTSYPSNSLGP